MSYLVATLVWVALCVAAAVGDDTPAGPVVALVLARLLVTGLIGLGIRALYVRRHRGRLVAPDTIWIAAAFAALFAAGTLTA